jgi:tripartite-type tricarboxylate transporter receptor subunit TctC
MISPLATNPYVLFAKKNMQAQNMNELIAWLKANPNRASVGTGSASYRLLAAFFQKQTGTQLTLVPYRGLAPAMQDLIAGEIDLSFGTPDQLPLARAQNLKVYAATSEAPLALAPDIPTFRGLGLPTLSFSDWWGLFAPKGTPRDIIGRLNAAAVAALSDPFVRSRIVELGFDVFPREQQTPNALGALQKAEAEKWWPIIRELGIKAE